MKHLRTLLPYYRPYLRGLAAGMALVVALLVGSLFLLAPKQLLGVFGMTDPVSPLPM